MAYTLISFAEKMGVPFKVITFSSKHINVFENTLATTVNEFFINNFVKQTVL